jgi:hypothetical protein
MLTNFSKLLNIHSKANNINTKYRYALVLTSLLSFVSLPLLANSLSVSYESSSQFRSVLDTNIKMQPQGTTVSAVIDLSEQWQISLDYQKDQDDLIYKRALDTRLDLITFGGGLSYYGDELSLALYYSKSSDDFLTTSTRNQANNQLDNSDSSLISVTIDHAWNHGNWFYDLSLSTQYNHFDNNSKLTRVIFNETLGKSVTEELKQTSSGNYTMLSSSFLIAHLWPLAQEKSIVVGSLFSWSYQLSGDSQNLSINTRRLNNTSRVRTRINQSAIGGVNNALTGDDNYGQAVIYLVYDFSATWSLDFNMTQNVATENNEQAYSVGVSYSF